LRNHGAGSFRVVQVKVVRQLTARRRDARY
jgi:hypothetical protein